MRYCRTLIHSLSASLTALSLLQPTALPTWALDLALTKFPWPEDTGSGECPSFMPLFQDHISLDLKGLPWPRACLSQTGWWELPELPSSHSDLSYLGASLTLHPGRLPRLEGLICGNAISLSPWTADRISPSPVSGAGEAMGLCQLSHGCSPIHRLPAALTITFSLPLYQPRLTALCP